MAKKPSIQKAILRSIARKKTVSLENVKEEVILPLHEGKKADYAITRTIKNLLGDGLIEAFNSEHRQYFRLTSIGKHKVNNMTLDAESSLVSTTWDGYWRMILLDLPEERKSEREALRYLLKKAGFVAIKNSVWVSMYPFEHLFTNIKKDLNLTTEMMIIVTDKIDEETEKELLRVFTK
jgi:DNA-binding transcriptional regulator PaaX